MVPRADLSSSRRVEFRSGIRIKFGQKTKKLTFHPCCSPFRKGFKGKMVMKKVSKSAWVIKKMGWEYSGRLGLHVGVVWNNFGNVSFRREDHMWSQNLGFGIILVLVGYPWLTFFQKTPRFWAFHFCHLLRMAKSGGPLTCTYFGGNTSCPPRGSSVVHFIFVVDGKCENGAQAG